MILAEASVAAVELVGDRLPTLSVVGKYGTVSRTRFRGDTVLGSCSCVSNLCCSSESLYGSFLRLSKPFEELSKFSILKG